MVNQCQGCQAGWEKYTSKPLHKGGKGVEMHKVKGGYKHEIVCCTARLYKTNKEDL